MFFDQSKGNAGTVRSLWGNNWVRVQWDHSNYSDGVAYPMEHLMADQPKDNEEAIIALPLFEQL